MEVPLLAAHSQDRRSDLPACLPAISMYEGRVPLLVLLMEAAMKMKHGWNGLVLAGMLMGLTLLSGCTTKRHKTTNTFSEEAEHIRKAARLCREYYDAAPAKKKEFDDFGVVRKWARHEKKRGVTQETFESTRDHQPYVIEVSPMGPMLHEQTGKDGKVFVTTPDGG